MQDNDGEILNEEEVVNPDTEGDTLNDDADEVEPEEDADEMDEEVLDEDESL